MRSQNKTIVIFLASLVILFTSCYTQRVADTKHFKGTAKVTSFGVRYIPNSGLIDTVYNGIIKLKETGQSARIYYFQSTIKNYEKNRYFVIHFSDINHIKIEPSALFDIAHNSLVLGRYSTFVRINTKIEDSKMTKKVMLDVILTWLNRDSYN